MVTLGNVCGRMFDGTWMFILKIWNDCNWMFNDAWMFILGNWYVGWRWMIIGDMMLRRSWMICCR